MKKYAKEKDVNYLKQIEKKIIKTEEYKKYNENFKDDKDTLRKYLLNLSLNIPGPQDFSKKESKSEKNIKILEATGEYLGKVQKLDEIKREYNNSVIEKTGKFLGEDINKNPFMINKKQLEMEFSRVRNEKINESELQIKSSYWENKLVKTIEGIRNAFLDEEVQKHNYDKKDFKKDVVYEFNDQVRKLKYKPLEVYEKYISGKITREELENDSSYKKANDVVNKIYKEKYNTAKDANLDFLIENKIFSSIIDNRYLIKDTDIMKTIEKTKENDKVRVGIYKEAYAKQTNKSYFPCGFTMENYNTEIILHVNKADFARKIGDGFKPDYEDVTYEIPATEPTLLCKYTKDQLIKIEKIRREKNNSVVNRLYRSIDLNKKDEYMKEKMNPSKTRLKEEDRRKYTKNDNERGAR